VCVSEQPHALFGCASARRTALAAHAAGSAGARPLRVARSSVRPDPRRQSIAPRVRIHADWHPACDRAGDESAPVRQTEGRRRTAPFEPPERPAQQVVSHDVIAAIAFEPEPIAARAFLDRQAGFRLLDGNQIDRVGLLAPDVDGFRALDQVHRPIVRRYGPAPPGVAKISPGGTRSQLNVPCHWDRVNGEIFISGAEQPHDGF
jgi:hypothetical protein